MALETDTQVIADDVQAKLILISGFNLGHLDCVFIDFSCYVRIKK